MVDCLFLFFPSKSSAELESSVTKLWISSPASKNLETHCALIGPRLQKKNTFQTGQHVSAAGSGSDCLARQDARAGGLESQSFIVLGRWKERTTSARGST